MIHKIVACAVFLTATPAVAGIPLWDKIEADMPFATAKELYPAAHVYSGKGLFRPMLSLREHKIGDCEASVDILIDRKVADPEAKVEGVRLTGDGCDSKMFNALLARYGEPSDATNDHKDKQKTARWVSEGKSITFRRDGSGWVDTWELNYTPIKDLGL